MSEVESHDVLLTIKDQKAWAEKETLHDTSVVVMYHLEQVQYGQMCSRLVVDPKSCSGLIGKMEGAQSQEHGTQTTKMPL